MKACGRIVPVGDVGPVVPCELSWRITIDGMLELPSRFRCGLCLHVRVARPLSECTPTYTHHVKPTNTMNATAESRNPASMPVSHMSFAGSGESCHSGRPVNQRRPRDQTSPPE